ncbi:MAG: prepilin-type N-terminal cleavage/methylation domain-containing protein [Candidatus Omnitrophica bacterium]|nr:prepilin-type N-terminal cleavage/methylation domain-containing protein [Candidatus Omnitrophota bacterium]
MKKGQCGFTLLEVVIAAAISSIIFFGAFGIASACSQQLDVIHTKMTLQEGPREALFKMAQEIRQTAWHKVSLLSTVGLEGSTDRLEFIVPIPEPDQDDLVDSHYAPKWASLITYSLDPDNHQILRTSTDLTTGATKQAVLANYVTRLDFSRDNASSGLITVRIDVQRTFSDGRQIPTAPIEMMVQAEARNP